jgi:membrane fusion protein (multidrug efflux system)
VHLKGAIKPNAISVPRKSVLEGAKGNFVWVVDNESKAEVRQVVLGQWQGDSVFVESGLFPGDKVVTDGIQKLSDGMAVQIVDKIKPAVGETQTDSGNSK